MNDQDLSDDELVSLIVVVASAKYASLHKEAELTLIIVTWRGLEIGVPHDLFSVDSNAAERDTRCIRSGMTA